MAESLLEPEYASEFGAWKKSPTPQTAGKLLTKLQPVLDSAVRNVSARPSPILHSKAKLLALDALQRYDPVKAKLRSHLMVNLRSLNRAAQQENIIHVPERVAMDNFRLRRGETELEDQLGRPPSDSELSDHLGMSRKRIGYVRGVRPAYAEGQMMSSENEEGAPSSPATETRPSAGASKHLLDYVYQDLDPVDQLILEHSMGLHGKQVLSGQQIAKRVGLSSGAISQRSARIQKQLDTSNDLWPMGG